MASADDSTLSAFAVIALVDSAYEDASVARAAERTVKALVVPVLVLGVDNEAAEHSPPVTQSWTVVVTVTVSEVTWLPEVDCVEVATSSARKSAMWFSDGSDDSHLVRYQ